MESKINPFPFLVKQVNIKPMNLESESLTNERPWPAKVVELGGGQDSELVGHSDPPETAMTSGGRSSSLSRVL